MLTTAAIEALSKALRRAHKLHPDPCATCGFTQKFGKATVVVFEGKRHRCKDSIYKSATYFGVHMTIANDADPFDEVIGEPAFHPDPPPMIAVEEACKLSYANAVELNTPREIIAISTDFLTQTILFADMDAQNAHRTRALNSTLYALSCEDTIPLGTNNLYHAKGRLEHNLHVIARTYMSVIEARQKEVLTFTCYNDKSRVPDAANLYDVLHEANFPRDVRFTVQDERLHHYMLSNAW
jgi:hypothetical protein